MPVEVNGFVLIGQTPSATIFHLTETNALLKVHSNEVWTHLLFKVTATEVELLDLGPYRPAYLRPDEHTTYLEYHTTSGKILWVRSGKPWGPLIDAVVPTMESPALIKLYDTNFNLMGELKIQHPVLAASPFQWPALGITPNTNNKFALSPKYSNMSQCPPGYMVYLQVSQDNGLTWGDLRLIARGDSTYPVDINETSTTVGQVRYRLIGLMGTQMQIKESVLNKP
jgi:hypothetical protein